MAFIFPNNSYIISLNLGDDNVLFLQTLVKKTGIRIVNEVDPEKYRANVLKAKHLIGTIIVQSQESQFNDISLIENKNHIIIEERGGFDQEYFLEHYKKWLESFIPQRLDTLIEHSFQSISSLFFPDHHFEFSRVYNIEEKFDVLTMIDISCLPYVGRGMVYANTQKLIQLIPEFKEKSGSQIRDLLRETTNQYLGVFNTRLNHTGLSASLGLPSQFDSNDLANVTFSGPYLPSIILADQDESIFIEIGLINQDGGEKIDLSSVNIEEVEEDEIDFF